jgi:hypothetical protein
VGSGVGSGVSVGAGVGVSDGCAGGATSAAEVAAEFVNPCTTLVGDGGGVVAGGPPLAPRHQMMPAIATRPRAPAAAMIGVGSRRFAAPAWLGGRLVPLEDVDVIAPGMGVGTTRVNGEVGCDSTESL